MKTLCAALTAIYFLYIADVATQKVDSCPGYACNPRGTFSFLFDGPNSTEEANIAWVSSNFIGPLPNSLGCVANPNNIVCQSNGPKDVGFISLDVATGKLFWSDSVLRFPELPVMDIYGDVIGSDGHYLVEYMDSGKLETPIPFMDGIFPVYSLLLSENSIVLIVSKNGLVIGYGTDGVVLASIELKGTVERSNGTFLPVAQPILLENRAYILTEFRPDNKTFAPENLGLQRLWAVDIYTRMVDRLHISWYYDFEAEASSSGTTGSSIDQVPTLMFNVETKIVMVNLPAPANSNMPRTLWGIQDDVNGPSKSFRTTISLKGLSMFDTTSTLSTKSKTANKMASGSYVWGLVEDKGTIVKITPANGAVDSSFNVSSLLKLPSVEVTSNVMVTRRTMESEDILIFGVKISPTRILQDANRIASNNTAFVVAVDGQSGSLLWMVPTPENMEVKGQIAGIKLNDSTNDLKDMIVIFAGDDKASKVFAISSK